MKYTVAGQGIQRIRRSPCGERGLKSALALVKSHKKRRSPCGERGLKYALRSSKQITEAVAPRAGSVG